MRALRDALNPAGEGRVRLLACEMEYERWLKLAENRDLHLRGDFFHVRYSPGVADCLFLNPPYDQDRTFKRLEARWLDRAAPILTDGGVLVFVVPYYALSACATMIATHFEDVRLYRFPGRDFDTFKQVVLLGRKTLRAAPSPDLLGLCQRWSESVEDAPDLPNPDEATGYPIRLRAARSPHGGPSVVRDDWIMAGFDASGVQTLPPWRSERGPMADLDHPLDLCERVGATYPVVSPPRPVHLAAALSAGVFNGLHVLPNPGHLLPPLLVKGTFRRKWETVDAKTNKDGAVTSETQIERPELDVWALDLRAGTYHQLTSSGEITSAASVGSFTFADLLDRYSASLLAALRAACPVLHDPGRDPEPAVEGLGRPLWPAQTTTVHAVNKLLDQRGQGALIVGEVGTGKTSIALALAKLRDRRRVLVICPPHLLASWAAQVRTVRPDARVVTLEVPSDLEHVREGVGPVVALLSRETAKLGHGVAGLEPLPGMKVATCPKCGAEVEGTRHAERRARCEALIQVPTNTVSRWALKHRQTLIRCDTKNPSVHRLIAPTPQGRRWAKWAETHAPDPSARRDLARAFLELTRLLLDQPDIAGNVLHALAWAIPDIAGDMLAILPSYDRATRTGSEWLKTRERIGFALDVRPDLGAHPDEREGYVGTFGSLKGERYGGKIADECWKNYADAWDYMHGRYTPRKATYGNVMITCPAGMNGHDSGYKGEGPCYGMLGATPVLKGYARGSAQAVSYALTLIMIASGFGARPCGEPLFQATASPRRYPVGTFIARKASALFDMLVIDEAHEYAASDTSAQGIVVGRLAQMANRRGIPVLYMTGSLVNGYADSAFHALRAVSPAFRATFSHKDRERFGDIYGLRKRVLVYESPGKGGLVRGAQSERILSGTKKAGLAPGVLPVLLLHHLLANAAIIHKADLEIGLPAQVESTDRIPLDPDVEDNLNQLFAAVAHAIAATRFQAGLAGKLFGAVTRLMNYPDVAACGPYEVCWPEDVPTIRVKDLDVCPGGLVASVPGTDPTRLLSKEAWLLRTVRDELEDGRGVLVLPSQVELLDRLAWVLEQAGIEALVLRSEKVAPHKREAWIDRHLNTRSKRVLITNPMCVQTGLNNLVSLATSAWYSNPECKPLVYRQANGRLHRPGQTRDVRSVFPLYDHKLPMAGHRLLMHKVGVSLAVDGLDPDAVLEAAGVGSEFSAGLNVGHQLYKLLVSEADQSG